MRPCESPVEAEPDHPPQPLAVPGEQLRQGLLVTPFEAEEQVVISRSARRSWLPPS